MNDKPIYLLPGDKRNLDGSRPVIYVGQAAFIGASGFLFCLAMAFIVLWFFTDRPPIETKIDIFRSYFTMVHNWFTVGDTTSLIIRKGISLVIGSLGFWWFSKNSWKPIDLNVQVRGRRLLTNDEGYNSIKREFNEQYETALKKRQKAIKEKNPKFSKSQISKAIESMPNLVLLSDIGLNPNEAKTFRTNPVKDKVVVPDTQRRSHTLVYGGSGRGKTQFILGIVMQIVYWIIHKRNFKLLFVDTPKADYSRFIPKKFMDIIAIDEASGLAHDPGADFLLPEDIERYFAGKIPLTGKDEIWPNSARIIGSGIGTFFAKMCGTDWTYANLVWGINQPAEKLDEMLRTVYPEATKILNSGEQTLGSVMFNLTAYTKDLFKLARIWDGFDYKHDILQFSARQLKKEKALTWWLNNLYPLIVESDGKILNQPFNMYIQCMFKGLINHLNISKPEWVWTDLKSLQALDYDDQEDIANKYLVKPIIHSRDFLPFYLEAITPIQKWATVWDEYEAKPRFSVRKWTLDENPEKKILVFSPSGRFSEMTDGLIRGLLFFMAGLIDDKYMVDDGTPECPQRNFYIVCDEFQSRGNMREFLMPILERGRSKGISLLLACQDTAQLRKIYGQEDLDFLQSNTGNIVVLGVNAGTTADAISALVGKKWFNKRHESHTIQENGKSTSINYQEHEALVITPDECSSKLGVKLYKNRTGELRYLYLPGLLADAYILKTPLVKYTRQYKYESPEWMLGIDKEADPISDEQLRKNLFGLLDAGVVAKEEQPSVPTVKEPVQSQATIDQDDVVKDAASDMTEEDYSEEELDAMEANIHRAERAPLYNLPSEEEGMQGSLMKDIALDVLGGSLAKSVSHVAEIFTEAKRNVTTSKKKADDAWRMKRDGLDEMTKH